MVHNLNTSTSTFTSTDLRRCFNDFHCTPHQRRQSGQGQDPTIPVWGTKNKTVDVADLAAASKACLDYISENDLGAGNWSGGQIIDQIGTEVGRVSYNGRVFAGKLRVDQDSVISYDPYQPQPNALTVHLTNTGEQVVVADLAAASKACLDYISENDLGAASWTGGPILDQTGANAGYVCYNGRVRAPDPHPGQNAVFLFEPVNPLEAERSELDVPGYGKISVTASLRCGIVKSVANQFNLNGKPHFFLTDVFHDGLGRCHMLASRLTIHPVGDYHNPAKVTKAIFQTIEKTVIDFLTSTEGKQHVLRNSIKDRASSIIHQENRKNSLKKEIAACDADLAEEQAGIAEYEQKLAALSGKTP